MQFIEKFSKLKFNKDFLGYSPEKLILVNQKKINHIIKITSGSNHKAAQFIDNLYKKITLLEHLRHHQ